MEHAIRLPFWLLPLSFIALFALVGIRCYRNYHKAPQFPGPFLAKISYAWLLSHTFTGKLNEYNAAVLEKYGSPARIAPDKILTNDPIILRHMSAPRSNFRRGTFYDAFAIEPPPLKNVLSQKDEKLHNALRAKLIRGYSGKDLPNLESDIDSNIANLVTLIRTESTAGRAIDFSSLAQYFTLDVLTHIAFSAPVGYLKQNKDVYSYIRKVSDFLQVLELGANNATFQAMLDSALMAPMRPKPTDKEGMGAMMGMAKKAVSARYSPDGKMEQDMLGSFLRCGLTQQEAESEAMVQVLGGSDSTATAIRMIILYVITSPAVYIKLLKEVNENDGLFDGSFITSANSRKLPYLQACIKEGLRMWPPLQALNSKLSPPGGETVNGVHIPGGIEVCHNAYTTQSRKEIYGPDANFFRPERWLEAALDADHLDGGDLRGDIVPGGETGDIEKAPAAAATETKPTQSRLARMNSTLELIFGSGRFGCLGRHIALIELDKVIPVLLREFEWRVGDPQKGFHSQCYGVFYNSEFASIAQECNIHFSNIHAIDCGTSAVPSFDYMNICILRGCVALGRLLGILALHDPLGGAARLARTTANDALHLLLGLGCTYLVQIVPILTTVNTISMDTYVMALQRLLTRQVLLTVRTIVVDGNIVALKIFLIVEKHIASFTDVVILHVMVPKLCLVVEEFPTEGTKVVDSNHVF
ncbi:hypothetical protein H2200_001614 [Cladophialophora chaetospira]|uniref:Cytochrome P450 n=1 Tax=Cladophialophora chaetospira TaxID=386627 RepID=A0AA38XL77_9EURO|nr:hypothetical protein H2200_001614 [Cladophialophora chaetospira]